RSIEPVRTNLRSSEAAVGTVALTVIIARPGTPPGTPPTTPPIMLPLTRSRLGERRENDVRSVATALNTVAFCRLMLRVFYSGALAPSERAIRPAVIGHPVFRS